MPETIPAELLELRTRIQEFVRGELGPLALEVEPGAEVPRELAARVRERSRALGLFPLTQPTAFGGSGAGPLALTVAGEALAAENSRLGYLVFGPGPGALAQSEGALRERYLSAVMRGELRTAFAFTERRDATRPTQALRVGDDLSITGTKAYVTGGASADLFCVMVQVQANETEPGGAAMMVVER